MSKRDVAELCYLAHMGEPFRSAFSTKLQNNFVYCGHDDGWFLQLYCKKTSYIERIVSRVVGFKFNSIARISDVPDLPLSICKGMLRQADKGILVTLRDLPTNSRRSHQLRSERSSTNKPSKATWEIPIYQFSANGDMDYLLNNYEALTKKNSVVSRLSYDGKMWKVNAA